MRPITVSVGPLATASANNICTSQTPSGTSTLSLNGTLASNAAVFTASIAGNLMTVSAVTSGVIPVGATITGLGVAPFTVVGYQLTNTAALPAGQAVGPVGGLGTYLVSVSQTVSSTTMYANAVATLDTPRRVLLTCGASTVGSLTIVGTDVNGAPITEVLAGVSGSTNNTALDFKTITSIYSAGTFSNAVTVGTNGVAATPWVRFDDWAPSNISIQCNVSGGAVNYTVQTSMDDPNSPFNVTLPYLATWVNTSDSVVVGATANQQSNFLFTPVYARVLLNSGTGTVVARFLQASNGPT
jgi:hypothetical protein